MPTAATVEPEVQQTLKAGQPVAAAVVAELENHIILQETVERQALPEPAPEE